MLRLLLLIMTLGCFVFSYDLKIRNNEILFISNQNIEKYKSLISTEQDLLLIKAPGKLSYERSQSIIKKECPDTCELVTNKDLPSAFKKNLPLDELTFIVHSHDSDSLKNIAQQISQLKDHQLLGNAYVNTVLDSYSNKISKEFFPLIFLGIFICLIIITRKAIYSFDFFLPVIFSALFSQAVIKFIWETSDLILTIVPLLTSIINFCLVLHIFYTAKDIGCIKRAIKYKKRPIMMMVITTSIGLISLSSSEINAIRNFGLLSSTILLVTFTITYFYLGQLSNNFNSKDDSKKLMPLVLVPFERKKSVIITSIFLFFISVIFIKKIPIKNQAYEYFPDSEAVNQSMKALSEKYLGVPSLTILIPYNFSSKNELSFLKKIEEIEKDIRKLKNIKTISPNELVKTANEIYSKSYSLPNSSTAYHLLFSKTPENIQENFNYEKNYKIKVFSSPMSNDTYEDFIKRTEGYFNSKNIDFKFSGLYYYLNVAQKEMMVTLAKSFFISLLIISFLTAFWLKRLSIIFTFIFINIIPVGLSFPILFTLGGSFNLATIMTYSISLGLIVDSTIHIINDFENGVDKETMYKRTKRPIVFSSISLMVLFSLFTFIPFLPIREFGLNLFILTLIALFYDIKILPCILTHQK